MEMSVSCLLFVFGCFFAGVYGAPPATSPAGVAYAIEPPQPRAQDTESIFTGGSINGLEVLKKLSQYDNNPVTSHDPDRCGSTVLMAMCLNTRQPKECLTAMANRGKEQSMPEQRTVFVNVQTKLAQGTATFGDLGLMGEAMLMTFGMKDPLANDAQAFVDGEMFFTARATGMLPPPDGTKIQQNVPPSNLFQAGQSWPISIFVPPNMVRHWILLGTTAEEHPRPFVYDPLPYPAGPQIFFRGDNTPVISGCGSQTPTTPSPSAQPPAAQSQSTWQSVKKWWGGLWGSNDKAPAPTPSAPTPAPSSSASSAVPPAARALCGKTHNQVYEQYIRAGQHQGPNGQRAGYAPITQAVASEALDIAASSGYAPPDPSAGTASRTPARAGASTTPSRPPPSGKVMQPRT